jgi:hypothetical protein
MRPGGGGCRVTPLFSVKGRDFVTRVSLANRGGRNSDGEKRHPNARNRAGTNADLQPDCFGLSPFNELQEENQPAENRLPTNDKDAIN